MKKVTCLIISLFIYCQFSIANTIFKLTDLSILLPLPTQNQINNLISYKDQNNLLPYELFEKIPFLINQDNKITYESIRAVGIRIDPCFIEGFGPQKCLPQIRIIWQPLEFIQNKVVTVDASLHTFYNFSPDEFKNFLIDYQNFKLTHLDTSLNSNFGVHPEIEKQGLEGKYWADLRKLILQTIKGKNIDRITFMKLKGMKDIWLFGGFNFIQNQYLEITIPGLTDQVTQQDFINEVAITAKPKKFSGGVFPSNNENDLFYKVLANSVELEEASEEAIVELVKNTADLENPLKHNPGTTDCVTCHVAPMLRVFTIENNPKLNLVKIYDSLKYKNDLLPKKHLYGPWLQTNLLRMFGYFDTTPLISERVVNETAEALQIINSQMNDRK